MRGSVLVVSLVLPEPITPAPTAPLLTVAWRTDGFVGVLPSDEPRAPGRERDSAAFALDITVDGAPLDLAVTFTWPRDVGLYPTRPVSRGATTWAADAGDLGAWARTPDATPGEAWGTTWTFTRADVLGTVSLLTTWADFIHMDMTTLLPARVEVRGTAPGVELLVALAVVATQDAPYVAGVVGA
ncbi:MAG TPA: hypothetical protein VGE77_07000 [Nocardioides sp.]